MDDDGPKHFFSNFPEETPNGFCSAFKDVHKNVMSDDRQVEVSYLAEEGD